jgi:hypothetical protein
MLWRRIASQGEKSFPCIRSSFSPCFYHFHSFLVRLLCSATVQADEHRPSAVISSSSDFLSGGIVGILSAHFRFASMSDAANWREMRDVHGRVYAPTTKP